MQKTIHIPELFYPNSLRLKKEILDFFCLKLENQCRFEQKIVEYEIFKKTIEGKKIGGINFDTEKDAEDNTLTFCCSLYAKKSDAEDKDIYQISKYQNITKSKNYSKKFLQNLELRCFETISQDLSEKELQMI